jgi:outer membrane autotransporter protein
MDASTWMGTVYGLWSPTDRLEITGLVGYGRVDYSSNRHMDYAESATSTIDRTAHGDTKGTQWEGTLTAAYAMPASGGWSYGPTLSVSATRLDLDGFAETGAQGLDFSYDKQSTDSLQFTLGFDVSKAISVSTGVVSPYARVQAVYEAKDDKRNVIIHYVDDTTGFFPGIRLTTLSPDRIRYLVGGGVSGQFARGWAGFADIETVVGFKDVSGYTATLGVRKEF